MECVAAIILAMILFMTGLGIGMEALKNILIVWLNDYFFCYLIFPHTKRLPNVRLLYDSNICGNLEYCLYKKLILSVFKLTAGIAAHSNAMISDAVHSASDVFSTIVVIIGIRFASKEADKEHPYGHERMGLYCRFICSAKSDYSLT